MTRTYKKDPITVGRVFTTFNCGDTVVIEYKNFKNVKVKFDNTLNEIWCRGDHLKTGNVNDPKAATVFGKGVVDGCTTSINGKLTTWYNSWAGMLERCYCPKLLLRHPTYRGCTVADEWLHLPTFKLWFDKNHREGFQLDKDLLVWGNKVYSAATCSYVPRSLNNLLKLQENSRVGILGVCKHTNASGYIAHVSRRDNKLSRYFTSESEAAKWYAYEKEAFVRSEADYYYNRGDISGRLYQVLVDFKVKRGM